MSQKRNVHRTFLGKKSICESPLIGINMYCRALSTFVLPSLKTSVLFEKSLLILKVGRYILCDRILRTQLTTFLLPVRLEFTTQHLVSNSSLSHCQESPLVCP